MARVVLEMTGDVAKLLGSLNQVAERMDQVARKSTQAGQAGQKAGKETAEGMHRGAGGADLLRVKIGETFNPARIASFGAGLLGLSGAGGAITLAIASFKTWVEIMREFSAEARKAQGQLVALAAIQEGGQKRAAVTAASRLATQYGITDRGQAFETIQAMQSIRGSLPAGLAAAEQIFAATRVDIPIELGTELEVLGASQGQAPGAALRRAYIAGKISGRSPKAIAQAAPSIKEFADPLLGFSIAAILSESIPIDQVATYTSRAGTALSGTGGIAKYLAGQPELVAQLAARKIDTTTQYGRLAALREMGVSTPEQIEEAGITEERERKAIHTLLRQFGRIEPIRQQIQREDVPGLLLAERAGIEAEIPEARTNRLIDQVTAAFGEETAFGPMAGLAMKRELTERIRGLAMRRLHFEQGVFGDLIDDEGRATGWDLFHADLLYGMVGVHNPLYQAIKDPLNLTPHKTVPQLVNAEMGRIREDLARDNASLETMVQLLRTQAQKNPGGPTRAPEPTRPGAK